MLLLVVATNAAITAANLAHPHHHPGGATSAFASTSRGCVDRDEEHAVTLSLHESRGGRGEGETGGGLEAATHHHCHRHAGLRTASTAAAAAAELAAALFTPRPAIAAAGGAHCARSARS